MFNNDIVINPGTFGGANVNTTYSLVGFSQDSQTLRRVSGTAATAPDELRIAHTQQKRNGVPCDQHMVRMDRTYNDTLKGPVVLSTWIVMSVPKGTTILDLTAFKEQVKRVVSFLQDTGTQDKLYNSEP